MTIHRPLVLLIATLVAATPAAAQDGVFVDPDSPSGKEYQIPLESVRRQADPRGGTGKVQPGARSAPLFGEGIGATDADGTPDGTAGGSGGTGGSDGSGGSGDGSAPPARVSPSDASPEVQEAVRSARSQAAPSDGGTRTAMLVGGGLTVVLLAAGGALIASRRPGGSRPPAAG